MEPAVIWAPATATELPPTEAVPDSRTAELIVAPITTPLASVTEERTAEEMTALVTAAPEMALARPPPEAETPDRVAPVTDAFASRMLDPERTLFGSRVAPVVMVPPDTAAGPDKVTEVPLGSRTTEPEARRADEREPTTTVGAAAPETADASAAPANRVASATAAAVREPEVTVAPAMGVAPKDPPDTVVPTM